MNYELIIKSLEKLLPILVKKERLKHIYGVKDYGVKLAKIYKLNVNEVIIAALAHDFFRDFKDDTQLKIAKKFNLKINKEEERYPILLHGKNAALYMRKRFNIKDNICRAIYYHTSGSACLDVLGKILVISDSLEESRSYPGVNELRKLSLNSLDDAYNQVIKNKITYAVSKKLIVLVETIDTWNKHIMEV